MSFTNYAEYAQDLKGIIREAPTYPSMSDTQRECLDVIASAMANILVNSPTSAVDWKTITSYANVGGEQWDETSVKTAQSTSNPQSQTGKTGPVVSKVRG